MLSKKAVALGAAVLIVITAFFSSFLTLTISRFLAVERGDSVIITREQFELFEDFRRLDEVRIILERDHLFEVDSDAMLTGAIRGMTEAMEDPYTYFFTPQEYRDFITRAQGRYGGIGLWVTVNDENNMITVVRPFETSPAFRAGIRTDDVILRVDGQDVDGSNLEKAVGMMRGVPGTTVTVSILSDGVVTDHTLERAIIEIPVLEKQMLENGIGVIRLLQFSETASENFEEALADLKGQGMQGLILDLRGNPGGMLEQCVQIADLFLPEALVVYSLDRQGNREEYTSDRNYTDIPLVVLVDEFSASASEVLAGALQDHARGTIIGRTTFGKALIQGIRGPFTDGSALKLTTAQYFTPNGRDIQEKGIIPDFYIELSKEEEDFMETNRGENIPIELDLSIQKGIEELMRKIGE